MAQEPGSTVKHVNFEWPDCLTGDGKDTTGTARGDYNISIHQNYRLNGSNFYTIFNLPIRGHKWDRSISSSHTDSC
jgi:hypothetical protein